MLWSKFPGVSRWRKDSSVFRLTEIGLRQRVPNLAHPRHECCSHCPVVPVTEFANLSTNCSMPNDMEYSRGVSCRSCCRVLRIPSAALIVAFSPAFINLVAPVSFRLHRFVFSSERAAKAPIFNIEFSAFSRTCDLYSCRLDFWSL